MLKMPIVLKLLTRQDNKQVELCMMNAGLLKPLEHISQLLHSSQLSLDVKLVPRMDLQFVMLLLVM